MLLELKENEVIIWLILGWVITAVLGFLCVKQAYVIDNEDMTVGNVLKWGFMCCLPAFGCTLILTWLIVSASEMSRPKWFDIVVFRAKK